MSSSTKGQTYGNWSEDHSIFVEFSEHSNMSAHDLIEESRTDIKSTMKRLLDYFEWMHTARPSPVSFNTARTRLGTLRGFYTYNAVTFPKGFKMPRPKRSDSAKSYDKLELWEHDDTGNPIGLNEVMRQFLDNMNVTHKTFALCMLSTGQKANVLLSLNMDFITDSDRFFLAAERVKTRFPVAVFFSQEATEAVKRYVKQHRNNADPSDPLFIDERGQRLSSKAIQDAFRRAALRMNVVNSTNPLSPTRFRHLFQEAGIIANVNADIIKVMLGHQGSISGEYKSNSRAFILPAYIKMEPYLTVYASNGNNDHSVQFATFGAELESLKQLLEQQKEEIADLQAQVNVLEDATHPDTSEVFKED